MNCYDKIMMLLGKFYIIKDSIQKSNTRLNLPRSGKPSIRSGIPFVNEISDMSRKVMLGIQNVLTRHIWVWTNNIFISLIYRNILCRQCSSLVNYKSTTEFNVVCIKEKIWPLKKAFIWLAFSHIMIYWNKINEHISRGRDNHIVCA